MVNSPRMGYLVKIYQTQKATPPPYCAMAYLRDQGVKGGVLELSVV